MDRRDDSKMPNAMALILIYDHFNGERPHCLLSASVATMAIATLPPSISAALLRSIFRALLSFVIAAAIFSATSPVAAAANKDGATSSTATAAIDLDEDLFNRALAHAGTMESQSAGITDRLREGTIEALYDVAKSMNDGGDRISSVLIWHALADDGSEGDDYDAYDADPAYDYSGHVPSAMSLGFSYYDADKPRSLHYFLMATSKRGKPHQAAMYNAGRLYLELDDPSGALAYMRECANLDLDHPEHARPKLTMTCRKAYQMLSDQLREHGDVGLEEAVECFPYADILNFPPPDSKEYVVFGKIIENLHKYMEVVRANSGEDLSGNHNLRKKAEKHLSTAIEGLVNFRSMYRDDMSKLQVHLIGYIVERIKKLKDKLNGEGGKSEL